MRHFVIFAVLVALSVSALAKPKPNPRPNYQQGLLVSVDSNTEGQIINGSTSPLMINHQYFYVTIAIGDLAYKAYIGEDSRPTKMIIGDPVEASADDNFLYFKMADGKANWGRIVQRTRYKKDAK